MKPLDFEIQTQTINYGDQRKFVEYKILMRQDRKPVGIVDGPSRATERRSDALKQARRHIQDLKKQQLFVIPVTAKHISDGEARSCSTCAIALALWDRQEEMGFSRSDYRFEVTPYGAWVEQERLGMTIEGRWSFEIVRRLAQLPSLIYTWGGRAYSDSMEEWAMAWDDWAESRYMTLSEWRDKHGYYNGERPARPGPTSFVLSLDAFQKVTAS